VGEPLAHAIVVFEDQALAERLGGKLRTDAPADTWPQGAWGLAGAGVVEVEVVLVTVLAGCVTVVAGGCVTVVVGCFTLTLIEVVVGGCVAVVDAVCAVLLALPPLPSLTASATPTPAAATTMRPTTKSHVLERERSRAPQCGHACAPRATWPPQFGHKSDGGGSGAGGCADICRLRYAPTG
jgi:hypothetical protein